MYSNEYFHGFRATLGNTVLKSDSLGFKAYYSNPIFVNPPEVPTSLFVACHESNGALAVLGCSLKTTSFHAARPFFDSTVLLAN
jgi:hypothetical protein